MKGHFVLPGLLAACACTGTTGGELIAFPAAAAGPADAQAGQPLAFTNGRGFDVTLTQAVLHVGAVYLNQSRPTSGAQPTSCVLPGVTYVAEVRSGLDVDLLSPELQPFATPGAGSTTQALAAEVWLAHGDVDAADDRVPILTVAGTAIAQKDGAAFPFVGALTIGKNRSAGSTDVAQPGKDPICKERIVSPIAVDLTPEPQGRLVLRIDPRAFFTTVDFGTLAPRTTAPLLYGFADDDRDQASTALYHRGVRSSAAYTFAWSKP